MKKAITLKGFLIIILLSGSIIKAQIPFDHVIIDANGPTDPWGKGSDDINGDGYPDLIVGGWTGGGLVWYEYPNWTKHSISDDIISTDIDVADIDNDGLTDIVAVSKKSLQWYKKPGWQKYEVATSISLHDVEVADFNGDGKLDMVARNQEYWFNNGDVLHFYTQGQTPADWSHSTISCPNGEGLLVYDINGDKRPDVIVNGMWYENTGNINNWISHSFSSSWNYNHTYIAIGDINGNGRMDIVLSPSEKAGLYHKIAWYEHPSDPNTTWPEHIVADNVEAVYHFIGTGDFNNDGKTDIATAEMQQGVDPDEVSIFVNQDNGTNWQKQVLSNNGSHSMQIVDIGNDGDLDLFGANWDQNNQIDLWVNKLNNTNPPPPPATNLDDWERHVIDPAKEWRAVFIDGKDLDGDGLKDIIAGAWWYKNPGSASGSWVKHTIGTPLNNMAYVYDFDGDGDLDILGTEGEGADANPNFVWAQNDGSGNFTILDNIEAGQGDFLQGVAIVRKDNQIPYKVALSWHKPGNGVQTLTVPSDPVNNTWTWEKISDESQDECLTAGDIDRDGDPDLLMGTKWLRNDGGSWSLFTLNPATGLPDRNKLADINQNGRLDAVVGYEAISVEGKLAWYEQPATITNTWPEHVIANVVGPMSVDAVDMDGDEDIDVVVGEHNLQYPSTARMLIFENTDGKGTTWKQHQVYQGDENHDGAVTVDIDNDGDLDILSIGWGHPRVLLYENLAISGTNSAPVLNNIEAGAASFTEGDDPLQVTGSLNISDADNANLQSATAKISTNFNSSEDELFFTNTAGITGSFDKATGILTLSGTASLTDYQNALRNIYYQNTNGDDPSTQQRTIAFTVNDGIIKSNTVSRVISIASVNDSPNLSNLESTAINFRENAKAVQLSGNIVVSDPDNTTLTGALISVTNNYHANEDHLLFNPVSGITASFIELTGSLELTGKATVLDYQLALRNILYQNNSDNPSPETRTISISVFDGADNSSILTRKINVIPVNDAPNITDLETDNLKFSLGEDPVKVTGTIKINDADNTKLQKGQVYISYNYQQSEDILSLTTTGNGINASFDASLGVLNLTGEAPVEIWQETLRNVTYQSKSDNKQQDIRKISFMVNDGTVNSNVPFRTVYFASDNEAPQIKNIEQFPVKYMINSSPVKVTSTLQLSDIDDNNLQSATIHIAKNYKIGEDQLTVNEPDSLTTYFNSVLGSLIITGNAPIEVYQSAIRSVTFSSSNQNFDSGTRRLDFSVSDGKISSTVVSRNIEIANNQTAPDIQNIENSSLVYLEKNTAVPLTSSLIVNQTTNQTVSRGEVKFINGFNPDEDKLIFNYQGSISGTFDSQSGILLITGESTAEEYQNALRSIEYNNINGMNSSDNEKVVTFTVWNGDLKSNSSGRKIIFTSTNAKPILGEIEGFQLLYENGGTSVPVTNTLSIIDLDDNYMTGATVEITSNYHQDEDYLGFENTGTIYGNFNASNGKMILSGVDTKKHYQDALRQVKYKNTSGINNYSPGIRNVNISLNDGKGVSNVLTRKITVSIITLEQESTLIQDLKIYPNPFSGLVTLQFLLHDPQPVEAEISDINGRIVYKKDEKLYNSGEVNLQMNLPQLRQGTYLLHIKIGNERFTRKIIRTP